MKNGRLKNPNRSQSCKCQVRSYIHKYKCLILKSSNITVGTSNLQYWGPVLTPLLNILLFLQQKVSNVSKTHLAWYLKESETVYINGILLTNLFWPTVRKNCSSDREKLCKIFEITGIIYSNSERSEQFLVTECFFNLFLEVSQI